MDVAMVAAWVSMLTVVGASSPATAPPVARFESFRYVGRDPAAVGKPIGPSQYRNPILPGFRPDPSIVRVGRDYYLAVSSFAYWPGIPIFHSRDLVTWTQIGAAIARPGQLRLDGLDTSAGLYAPDLKYHAGLFYLLNTCLGCGGNYVVTARDPAGPWSDPTWLPFEGIDPAIFFEKDGHAWVVNNGPPPEPPRYSGHRAIWIQRIDLATLTMVGERHVLVDGGADIARQPVWIEGPHIVRHGGFHYLIAAEGGTGTRHSEVAFRATSLLGPYAAAPDNPILTQRDLPARRFPVTSAGHADLVETPTGDWWAVYLATRPYAGDLYNTGRETFLQRATWRDGWPRITAPGARVPLVAKRPAITHYRSSRQENAASFLDRFAGPALASRWTWLRTPTPGWWRTGRTGLVVTPQPDALGGRGRPGFVAVRQDQVDAQATVTVRFVPAAPADRAGLVAFQDVRRFFALTVAGAAGGGREVRLERRAGKDDPEDGAVVAARRLAPSDAPVRLRVTAEGGAYRFTFRSGNGGWQSLGGVQKGTILSTHDAGGFTGTMLGLYAHGTRL